MPRRDPTAIRCEAEEIPIDLPRIPDEEEHKPFVNVLNGDKKQQERDLRLVMQGRACSHCGTIHPVPPGPGEWRHFKDNLWPRPIHEARRLVFERCCPLCATPCTPEFAAQQMAMVT